MAVIRIGLIGLAASAVVAPLDAHPYVSHRGHYEHHVVHRPYQHREFCSWHEANAWITYQRAHGFECRYEWHGPHCWVYYR